MEFDPRIEQEIIDGKIYYSVYGIPFEIMRSQYDIWILCEKDEPDYICQLQLRDASDGIITNKVVFYKTIIKERFKVKVKDHSVWISPRLKFRTDYLVREEDGYAIKRFAIGTPKKSVLWNIVASKSAPAEQSYQYEVNSTTKFYSTNSTAVQEKKDNDNTTCYVYIMKNERNGYYKIGISNNPQYRERTLQSQEPEITMIFKKPFDTRYEAYCTEQGLHEKYSSLRLRGEWFKLEERDVRKIINKLI